MRRIYFTVLGLGLFTAVFAMAVAFGVEALDGPLLVAVLALVFAADLFVVGGLTEEMSIDSRVVEWYRLVGAGAASLGVANLAFGVQRATRSGTDTLGAVAFAVAGIVLVLIGVDVFRGGVHHDLSRVT